MPRSPADFPKEGQHIKNDNACSSRIYRNFSIPLLSVKLYRRYYLGINIIIPLIQKTYTANITYLNLHTGDNRKASILRNLVPENYAE
jgi:hypothetical protein